MKPNKCGRLTQAAFLLLITGSAGSALAQVGASGGIQSMASPTAPASTVPCPHPFTTPPMTASGDFVNVADMPAGWSTHAHQGIGGTAANTWVGYSFDFRKFKMPGPCCQITNAQLTITFKALQGGPSNSSTSGNDLWNVLSRGKAVTELAPAITAPIYGSSGATTGQTVTKTETITDPTVLASGFLSIFVEDDTEVVSASLVVSGCCVNVKGKGE